MFSIANKKIKLHKKTIFHWLFEISLLCFKCTKIETIHSKTVITIENWQIHIEISSEINLNIFEVGPSSPKSQNVNPDNKKKKFNNQKRR